MWNSIENIIRKGLIDNECTHEKFTAIITKEEKYCELKESIRMMKSQRSDIERNKLIEEGEIIGIDQLIKWLYKMKESITFDKT